MLMQKMNVPETKYLLSVIGVPTAKTIQIHSFSKLAHNISEKTAHESKVVCINWDESRNEELFLVV